MSGFWSSETLIDRLPDLVDPFDPTRIKSCAYELSMGDQSHVTRRDNSKTNIRPRLDRGVLVNIPPGQLAQLVTHEYVKIPNDAIGLLSMKSKFKMNGLVNISGFHVDPGYEGRLVFAVFNAGSSVIVIKQESPTFILWYVSLDSPTNDTYEGSRQGLKDITDDQIMKLMGPTYNPTALAERVATLERHHKWWRRISVGLVITVLSLILGIAFDFISLNAAISYAT